MIGSRVPVAFQLWVRGSQRAPPPPHFVAVALRAERDGVLGVRRHPLAEVLAAPDV